jgi:hypothetical protein
MISGVSSPVANLGAWNPREILLDISSGLLIDSMRSLVIFCFHLGQYSPELSPHNATRSNNLS